MKNLTYWVSLALVLIGLSAKTFAAETDSLVLNSMTADSGVFEASKDTDVEDANDAPGSRGYINLKNWSVYGDSISKVAKVRVGRLFSSQGKVTVAYKTVDGAAGKAGLSYVEKFGILEWEDGESDEKTIEIELIADTKTPRRDFFVDLYDVSAGAEILGWRTHVYQDSYFQDKKFDDFSGLIAMDPTPTFAEGSDAVFWVKRLGGSTGEVTVNYNVRGCGSNMNDASSDPREGFLIWADGDRGEKSISLHFNETDEWLDSRLDCSGFIHLTDLQPITAAITADQTDGRGLEFLVYNNDFTKGIVHAAQPVTGTAESLALVEIKLVRRGPPIQDTEIVVRDTPEREYYRADRLSGQNGVHFDMLNSREVLNWAAGDTAKKSIFLEIKDDNSIERDSMIILNPIGEDYDRWRYLYVYSSDDEPIFLAADTDGDGLPDKDDPDMDGDGVYDWWDSDIDGDGYDNSLDSHKYDDSQWVDTDYDGVADEADAFPLDASESLDTDSDGTGNNADTDDDGDGVADAEDAFSLDASESVDSDGDGTGNNADTDDDGDSVADEADAFPLDASESLDTDSDGTGNNADTDDDDDGVADAADAFPLDASESVDTDADGTGDNADTDDDGDGVADETDTFPLDASESLDTDSDGIGNNADTDDDDDGVADAADAFPLDASESVDSDGDGTGNNADTDDDGDGVADEVDAFPLGGCSVSEGQSDFGLVLLVLMAGVGLVRKRLLRIV